MLGLLLTLGAASAGDRALYERALALIDEHYLYPRLLQPEAMFVGAGRQAADRIEWLLVHPEGPVLELSDGEGAWTAEVRLDGGRDLPAALSRLEDAIRAAGRPIDPDLDLRVELLRGVVKGLDRHTVVLHAEGLERFDERLSGTLTGIGVQVGVQDAALVIRSLVPGGPAERAGVMTGDVVLKINGVSTIGMDTSDAGDRLRGPAGSTVVLTVRRGAATTDLTLVRDQVKLRNVTDSVAPNGIGVVKVEHFSELTHEYLQQSLDDLGAVGALDAGLVVDLRGNTGGSLIQSADAADTFVKSGTLVSTVGRDGGAVAGLVPRLEAQPSASVYAMPLAVLMDHDTASGSEILAGALATLDRAILVGTTSFGKGTVQKVYQIDADIKLKLTVAEYLLNGDVHVANVGLQPDVALSTVRFGPDGVWWAAPERERARLAPTAPLVYVADEQPGWRTSGMTPPARDAALDVAAAVVAAADGPSRADMLDTAERVVKKLAATEDARVVEAFAARGIDWAPRTTTTPLPEPRVSVRLAGPDGLDVAAGQRVELVATVVNQGATLHRAALRLRSVNPLWDDLVIPLGRLEGLESATGTTTVQVPWTSPTRVDPVEIWLEAQDVPATRLDAPLVRVEAAPSPPLAVSLRPVVEGDVLRVDLDIESRGDRPLDAVSARFKFPDVEGVELVEGGTEPGTLAPRGHLQRRLDLRLAPGFADATVPLTLVVSAEGYGRVAQWDVTVGRAGAPIRLEPPTMLVRASALVQAPGTATLTIRASDDRALDHVVVEGGIEWVDRSRYEPAIMWEPRKLAWRPGAGRRAELSLPVEVVAGANRFDIVAEDRAGLRTVQSVYVLGDPESPTAAADGGAE